MHELGPAASPLWVLLRHKMNLRFKLLSEAKRTNNENIRRRYRAIRNEVTHELRRAKAEHYEQQFEKVRDVKAFWKLLNKAAHSRNLDPPPPAIRRDDGTLATDDSEKAELLNQYFATIGERQAARLPMPSNPPQSLIGRVTPTVETVKITQEAVCKHVEALNPNKATGPDGIAPRLLKLAGSSITPSLTEIYNQSLDEWRFALV